MSILASFAAWLEQIAALQPYAADGIYTAFAPASPSCALCEAGASALRYEISGRCTQRRKYHLLLRTVALCNSEREEINLLCESLARYCIDATECGTLPHLPNGAVCSEVWFCGAAHTGTDDTALATYQLTFELEFTQI